MDVLNYGEWFRINERLGVPDFIQDEGKRLYDEIINNLKKGKIVRTEDGLTSMASIENVKVGDSTYPVVIHKLTIKDYKIDKPSIASLRVAHAWEPKSSNGGFDYKRGRNVDKESTDIETIMAVDFDIHNQNDIIEYLEGEGRSKYISSISHELMHSYDSTKRKEFDLGKSSEYQTASEFRSGIEPVDKFMHFIYFTDAVESTVRPSEIASKMKAEGITKSKFLEFLKTDRTWTTLKEISEVNVDDMIQEISNNQEYVDKILSIFSRINYPTKADVTNPKEVVEDFLNLIYINIANTTIENYENRVKGILSRNPLAGLFDSDRIDIEGNEFRRKVTKYRDNPIGFFRSYEKHFKRETSKVMKKLTKLYDMAEDDEITNDKTSILNRELHQKITGKGDSIKDNKLRESFSFDEFIDNSSETKSEE